MHLSLFVQVNSRLVSYLRSVLRIPPLFNKTNRGTKFPQIYFCQKLYVFRAVPLSIIRSFPLYIRHWCMSCRFDDCFQARLRWNRVPSKSCLKAVTKPAWHIPVPNVQWKPPDDGQRNCPKHVEFLEKINLGNLCVCWFYLKDIFRRLFQSFQVLTVKGLDHFLPYQSQFIIRSTCHSVIRPS